MKITFMIGATATKLIKGKADKKPTRFFGGETEDIVDKEAKQLVPEFAAKADSEEAREFLKGHTPNPRTRRQKLDATTPGLAEKLAAKRAVARMMTEGVKQGATRARTEARSKTALLGDQMAGRRAPNPDA